MADEGDTPGPGEGGAPDDGATPDAPDPDGTEPADRTAASDESELADAETTAADGEAQAAAAAGDASGAAEIAASVGASAKSLAAPLVASKLRIFLLVLVGTAGLIGGGFALGVLGAPEVAAVQNDFGAVSENETVIRTNLTVSNPNPIGVSLGGVTIDYHVDMNDVQVANGTKNGISIGTGNSTMQLETTLYNEQIPPWWTSHVENDERTAVTIDATVSSSTIGQSRTFTSQRQIQTDILGQFQSEEDRPINGNLPVIDDPLLIVTETDAAWGDVSQEETPLEMDFTMFNPNPEPYAIAELRYNITMNDVLVADGATEDPFVITGGATNTLHATADIQNQRLDEWWVSHLNRSLYGHQVTQFRIDFTAVVELPNGETTTVPLDDLTYEEWIGTDILGEGGDVGVPPNGSASSEDGVVDGNTSDDGLTDGNTTDGDLVDGNDTSTNDSDGNDSDDGGFLG